MIKRKKTVKQPVIFPIILSVQKWPTGTASPRVHCRGLAGHMTRQGGKQMAQHHVMLLAEAKELLHLSRATGNIPLHTER